jgi:hypothetical protein
MTSIQKSRTVYSILSLLAVDLAGCPANNNDLGTEADGGVTVSCQQGGTTYQPGQTVVLSACTSCVCQANGQLGMCTGLCQPDAATNSDAKVTCQQNGTTYQVGETAVLSACTTCVCQADGQLGMCTGLCQPDAAVKADTKVTCQQNGNTYQVGETTAYSECTTCVCQADGQLGMCTGECPADASTNNPADLCTSTGGQLTKSLCCQSASDYPNSCLTGACGCSTTNSHTINTCSCPTGCFDPAHGCVGKASVCTPGADQTCNSSPIVNAIYGHCLSDGRCTCNTPYALLADGKCG